MRGISCAVLAFSCLPFSCVSAAPLESVPWPTARSCTDCAVLQFGVLEFKLPPSVTGKVYVSDMEPFAVHFLPPHSDSATRSALIMSSDRKAYVGKYEALGLPSLRSLTGTQFFDRLDDRLADAVVWTKIRRIEGVENARRFTKATRPGVTVYYIESGPNDSRVHIVVDGRDKIYSLLGDVSPAMYDALIANLAIKAEP